MARNKVVLDETAIRVWLRDPFGPVSRLVRKLTDKAAEVARGTVHVRTGETLRSIETDFSQGATLRDVQQGEVSASYAVFFLEKGVKPHIIVSHGDWSLHNPDAIGAEYSNGYMGRVVLHPGFPPKPFLTTGLWSLNDSDI